VEQFGEASSRIPQKSVRPDRQKLQTQRKTLRLAVEEISHMEQQRLQVFQAPSDHDYEQAKHFMWTFLVYFNVFFNGATARVGPWPLQ
jgi:hypothetical protein